MSTQLKITDLELKVLKGLFESSKGNGHDFGCTADQCVKSCVTSPRQLSGVLSSLSKKGLIEIYESFQDDGTINFNFKDLAQVEQILKGC